MAEQFTVGSTKALVGLMRRHFRQKEVAVRAGARQASRLGRNYIARETVPEAFGELRKSVHTVDTQNGADIIIDAPHAAAVEVGSRPHTPPLDPLIAWVKLRGMQGLSKAGRVKSNRTTYGIIRDPNREAARVIAGAIKNREKGGAVGVDVPTQIARAIQQKIAREGTKPHWYARASLPVIRAGLDRFVTEQLHKPLA